jgi:hypothetical protein
MNQHDLETTYQEFKMQLATVKAQIRHGGGGNAGTGAVVVKLCHWLQLLSSLREG